MNDAKQMTGQEKKSPQATAEATLRPAVDIFEDDAGITVQADMPGVSREHLEVHIDSDTLSIEGEAAIRMPEDMEPVYADVRFTRYQRRFTLSRELDTDKIDANLRDGVLTLRIPKREEHKPRKIEVQV
jgi:HSP20 family protein